MVPRPHRPLASHRARPSHVVSGAASSSALRLRFVTTASPGSPRGRRDPRLSPYKNEQRINRHSRAGSPPRSDHSTGLQSRQPHADPVSLNRGVRGAYEEAHRPNVPSPASTGQDGSRAALTRALRTPDLDRPPHRRKLGPALEHTPVSGTAPRASTGCTPRCSPRSPRATAAAAPTGTPSPAHRRPPRLHPRIRRKRPRARSRDGSEGTRWVQTLCTSGRRSAH